MVQVTFLIAAEATTTDITGDATTSGPIKLPAWAPDIASMATTTVEDQQAIILGTTGGAGLPLSPHDGYNTRCFGLKSGRTLRADNTITVDYTAVGELVRT